MVFEDFGVLIAGSAHSEHRRRGVQAAVIGHLGRTPGRLGLRWVLVGSTPDGPADRNPRRSGFVPFHETIGLQRPLGAPRIPQGLLDSRCRFGDSAEPVACRRS